MRAHTTTASPEALAATTQERPEATVVITTKNRKEDLRTAIASVLAQVNARVEVIVIDDGSTDGTSAMVSEEFPSVRLVTELDSAGYIVRRNQAAQLATAPVIFSIDDDAAFASPRTVQQTLADFDSPEVGAVAIPFINVNQDTRVRQSVADAAETHAIFAYIGTAHAIRRDVFLAIGGYRALFFHQGEEMDLCIRMLDKGLFVRVGRADPIHHFESPRRDNRRIPIYGRRNDILFTALNVPFLFLPIHMAATSFNGLRAGLRRGHVMWSLEGLARGYVTALCHLRDRRPVSWRTYRDFRLLKRREMAPVSALSRFRNDCGSKRKLT
jgi:glycosyltransferase involved in cell wall biosynthesis